MPVDAFPQQLVILGGGSAGWMAAAYLDRSFNRPGRRRLSITLVESPAIGRIGVGEATIPTLRQFCDFVGIDEPTLMNRTQATFKHGILFRDWLTSGHDYFHPFEAIEPLSQFNPAPSWLARRAAGEAGPFDRESGVQRAVALAGLAPKRMTDRDYMAPLPYAYHLDAEAFGDLLRDVAKARGVAHVEGRVAEVETSEAGDVAALRLDDGRRVAGDFFIDCSGFAALLIGKTLGVPFDSFGDVLSCDRAVAIPAPYAPGEEPQPMTTCTAMAAGWRWRIGLRNREGHGYVYSSRHLSPEQAEAELRAATGLAAELPVRHLPMRVGMPRQSWCRNVVAMGLAGGFIEPLESTGIHFVELALQLLVRYFPLSGINPAARDRFNRMMAERYLETRDFIVAHYCLTRRDDTAFWREVRDPARIPETVRARLDLWRDRHPSREDNDYTQMVFSHSNWQAILYGMDGDAEPARANAQRWVPNPQAFVAERAQQEADLLQSLPRQGLFLEGVRTFPERADWAA